MTTTAACSTHLLLYVNHWKHSARHIVHVGVEATPIVGEVDPAPGGLSLNWGFPGPLPPYPSHIPCIEGDVQSYTPPL